MQKLTIFLAFSCFFFGAFAEGSNRQYREVVRKVEDLEKRHPKDSRLFVGNFPSDGPTVDLEIGSPRKFYPLSMETTHNQVWLIDPEYPNLQQGQQVYIPSQSKSSINMSRTVSGQSGSAKYSGNQYVDLARDDKRYWNQTFGAIKSASISNQSNPELPAFGISGIAWKLNESRTEITDNTSLIVRLLQTYQEKVISVWQGRYPLAAGYVIYAYTTEIGGVLSENCSDISYVPLQADANGFGLYFELDSFSVGRYSKRVRAKIYADHGLPFIYVPDDIFRIISKELNPVFDTNKGWYTVDCGTLNTSSNWVFTINGKDKVLVPSDFITDDFQLPNNRCLLGLDYSHNLLTPTDFALGTTFLRAFCAIHDVGNNQLGFGKASHDQIVHEVTETVAATTTSVPKHTN